VADTTALLKCSCEKFAFLEGQLKNVVLLFFLFEQ